MLSVKTLIRALATSLCLLLAMSSPGVAGESPFESLPIGPGSVWAGVRSGP